MDESFRIFLRGLGAITILTSCFPGVFPITMRIGLVISFPFLFAGSLFSEARFVAMMSGEGLPMILPEVLTGILIAAPACIGCWTVLLAANWFAELVAPQSALWFGRRAFDGEGFGGDKGFAPRIKTLVLSIVLLGGVTFFPYLPEVFARIAETLRTFPSLSEQNFLNQLATRRILLLSVQISWVAALGLALPILAVSLAFDATAALISRYVRPLRDDPSLWSVRALFLGVALAASVYSLTDTSDQLARENLSRKRIEKIAELVGTK